MKHRISLIAVAITVSVIAANACAQSSQFNIRIEKKSGDSVNKTELIEGIILDRFKKQLHRKVSKNEIQAWKSSLL